LSTFSGKDSKTRREKGKNSTMQSLLGKESPGRIKGKGGKRVKFKEILCQRVKEGDLSLSKMRKIEKETQLWSSRGERSVGKEDEHFKIS